MLDEFDAYKLIARLGIACAPAVALDADITRAPALPFSYPVAVKALSAGIAHKTGDWPPLLGNDVGIIYAPSGPIVAAVFTNLNRGDFFELEATEGRIGEDVLNAWGRAR